MVFARTLWLSIAVLLFGCGYTCATEEDADIAAMMARIQEASATPTNWPLAVAGLAVIALVVLLLNTQPRH